MAKYQVYLSTTASLSVSVDISTEGLDEDEIEEAAIEAAFNHNHYICAQCSGWGRKHSFDLGEWEPEEEHPVERVDGE